MTERQGWSGGRCFLHGKRLVKLTNKFPLRTLVEVTGCHHKYLQGQAGHKREGSRMM